MAKVDLTNIASGYSSTAAINTNNELIEEGFENTVSRDGSTPNQMGADFDMNGFNILNQGNPISVSGLEVLGDWSGATTYSVGDIVYLASTSSSYICILENTNTTPPNATYWQLLVSGTALPAQTGNADRALTTDGASESWGSIHSDYVDYTQGGTGSTERTVLSKLQDIVSVKDFGATGDGATDDTSAIQAAIDDIGTIGGIVYFPPGTYLVTALTVSDSAVTLTGAGIGATNIVSATTTGDIITVAAVTGFSINNMDVGTINGTESTAGAHIVLNKTVKPRLYNLNIRDFWNGIEVNGGWFQEYESIVFNASSWKTTASNAMMLFTVHSSLSGNWWCSNIKLHRIDGVGLNAVNPWVTDGYRVESCDWLQISNSHVNKANNGLRISPHTNATILSDVDVSGCYFDEAGANNVLIDGANAPTTFGGFRFTGGTFFRDAGSRSINCAYTGATAIRQVLFGDCIFERSSNEAIRWSPTTTSYALKINDSHFLNPNDDGTPRNTIYLAAVENVTISSNTFDETLGNDQTGIILGSGTSADVVAVGNNFKGMTYTGTPVVLNGTGHNVAKGNQGAPDYEDIAASTISSGAISDVYAAVHSIETEGAASTDNLDDINDGYANQFLTLVAVNASHDVVVRHNGGGTGNIRLAGATDFTLTHTADSILLVKVGSLWIEVSRSDNIT